MLILMIFVTKQSPYRCAAAQHPAGPCALAGPGLMLGMTALPEVEMSGCETLLSSRCLSC